VAKGLQMPVDEVIPSREKSAFMSIGAKAQALAAQQPSGVPVQPDGSPKGGMDGNTVMNRSGGQP